MNTLLRSITLFVLMLSSIGMCFSQERQAVDFTYTSDLTDNSENFEALRPYIVQLMTDYKNSASIVSTGGSGFTKLNTFSKIFDGNAQVYDDLHKDGGKISVADYTSNVLEYLTNEGVEFDLSELRCEYIKLESNGYYTAKVLARKDMFNGLKDDNTQAVYSKGRKLDMVFLLTFPTYDLSQGQITDVTADSYVVAGDRIAALSVGGYYGIGAGYGSAIAPSFNAVSDVFDFSPTASNYGLYLNYRTNIGNGEKLFFIGGIRLGQQSVRTDFSGLNMTSLSTNKEFDIDFGIRNELIGDVYTVDYDTNIKNEKNLKKSRLIPVSVQSGQEVITTWDISVPLGISYKLMEGYSSRLYIDVALCPGYRLGYKGDLTFEGVEGLNLPTEDENFPAEVLLESYPEIIKEHYTKSIDEVKATNIQADGGFSLGLLVSPTYEIMTTFNSGIEIGIDLNANLLSAFKKKDFDGLFLSDKGTLTPLDRTNSVYEDINQNVKLGFVGFKIGYYYEIK